MKGSLSINEYIKKIKELLAQLVVVIEVVSHFELILYMFNGLDSNYNPYNC